MILCWSPVWEREKPRHIPWVRWTSSIPNVVLFRCDMAGMTPYHHPQRRWESNHKAQLQLTASPFLDSTPPSLPTHTKKSVTDLLRFCAIWSIFSNHDFCSYFAPRTQRNSVKFVRGRGCVCKLRNTKIEHFRLPPPHFEAQSSHSTLGAPRPWPPHTSNCIPQLFFRMPSSIRNEHKGSKISIFTSHQGALFCLFVSCPPSEIFKALMGADRKKKQELEKHTHRAWESALFGYTEHESTARPILYLSYTLTWDFRGRSSGKKHKFWSGDQRNHLDFRPSGLMRGVGVHGGGGVGWKRISPRFRI